jgi:hypothetical protein
LRWSALFVIGQVDGHGAVGKVTVSNNNPRFISECDYSCMIVSMLSAADSVADVVCAPLTDETRRHTALLVYTLL